MNPDEPLVRRGEVASALAAEHPGLWLAWTEVEATPGPTPRELAARLRGHADRIGGAQALALRGRDVPHAHRVFFRHVGLDPDVTRVPIEAVAIERLVHGGFRSRNLLDDALTIALVETGVPLWALDATTLDGPLGLRLARAGERIGREEHAPALPAGRIVVADARAPVAPLFGEVAEAYAPTRQTRALRLFALRVAGVPAIHVEEALWTCAEALDAR